MLLLPMLLPMLLLPMLLLPMPLVQLRLNFHGISHMREKQWLSGCTACRL